jgi:hypothetical protein
MKNSYKQKKNIYSKGVCDLSEENIESNFYSYKEETLFMEIETKIYEGKGIETMDLEEEENRKIDGEVDLEEELMHALSEIKKLREKILKQKEYMEKFEEEHHDSKAKMSERLEETKNTIMNLKVQLE